VVLVRLEHQAKVMRVVMLRPHQEQTFLLVVVVAHLLLALTALLVALQVLAVMELHHPYRAHR
jgi:hypothetical protein